MKNLKKKKKGFTLIELMAVIAIIVILAAVLVPTVNGYINRSKKTAIVSQVRNAVTAIETYNATATINTIKDEVLVGSIVAVSGTDPETGKIDSDLLSLKNVDRILKMSVGLVKEINEDPDAINKIELNDDGTIASYTCGTRGHGTGGKHTFE